MRYRNHIPVMINRIGLAQGDNELSGAGPWREFLGYVAWSKGGEGFNSLVRHPVRHSRDATKATDQMFNLVSGLKGGTPPGT